MQPQLSSINPYSEKVMSRYTDGYRMARVIVGVGDTVKALGVIAFVLMLLIGFAASSAVGSGVTWLGGALFGGIIWLLSWVMGVIISAQGQVLKANIDEAVNTSPFLSDEQRARIMSLL